VRKIIFALAFGVLLLPDYGFTLGLGEIEVSTALNQELDAEIELLSAAPEDVETLIVKLASREEFNRAGIDRPYMLSSLKFNAEIRDGEPIIRVTSNKPIREPFLNFLVEIDWPKGHMMREYTILLDPPVFMGQQQSPADSEQMRPAALDSSSAAPTMAPEPQGGDSFRPTAGGMASGDVTSAPVPVPTMRAQAAPSPAAPSRAVVPSYAQTPYQPPQGHRIQPGDTLWSLADALRPDRSVSIEQMMLAMLRTNPEAFINENINGLKKGYILRIPDRDDIATVNHADAVALVREQHALWREYQQTVTDAEPASAMDREAEDDVGAGAGVEADSDARLEIVAAGSGVSASGSKDPVQMSESELRAELAVARESLETERVEKEELQQRVAALESQVEKMKALLTLEDTDLAEMQQAAIPAEAEFMPAVEGAEDVVLDEQAEFEEEVLSELDAVAEDITALEEEATVSEEPSVEETEEETVFVEEGQLEVVEETLDQPVTSTEDFSVAPSTQPAFMQQKQGPLATLLNNPVLLAAAGGGLLLVLLLVALIIRRRKGGDDEPQVASNLDSISELEESDAVTESIEDLADSDMVAAEAVAGAEVVAEKQTRDAAATTEDLSAVEDTVITPPEGQAEETARDDVIAEADVYLAYGIYQQAEELLQNAIKQNPDNDSYRVKLAETYLSSRNSDAFVDLATEMNQRRAGEDTAAWKKIADIGTQLCPEHALFKAAAAGMVDDLSMDDLASHKPESMDIDVADEGEQQALVPDLDLGLDESEVAATLDETVEFDLSETGAETVVEEEGVEFDLSEAGAETTVEAEEDAVEFDLAEAIAESPAEAEEETVEFDLDETQALEPEQANEEEFSLDIEADELDIGEEAESLTSVDDTQEEEFSLDDVDASSLGLDITEDDAEASAASEMAETDETGQSPEESAAVMDLSDMDLDEAIVEAVAQPEMDDELDLSELDDIDEVGTKLDLAKAYLDMGDADGTRSILDEVMSEGDDTQKREAEELLRQIG